VGRDDGEDPSSIFTVNRKRDHGISKNRPSPHRLKSFLFVNVKDNYQCMLLRCILHREGKSNHPTQPLNIETYRHSLKRLEPHLSMISHERSPEIEKGPPQLKFLQKSHAFLENVKSFRSKGGFQWVPMGIKRIFTILCIKFMKISK
jgi:hypothetical protein